MVEELYGRTRAGQFLPASDPDLHLGRGEPIKGGKDVGAEGELPLSRDGVVGQNPDAVGERAPILLQIRLHRPRLVSRSDEEDHRPARRGAGRARELIASVLRFYRQRWAWNAGGPVGSP